MNLLKPALAGALLGPWTFTLLGGTAFLGGYSPDHAFFVYFFILIARPLWFLPPAGAAVLTHAVVEKGAAWVSGRAGAVFLSVGVSVLSWNAATLPLRFLLSMRHEPEARPNAAPTGWIFMAATATGLAWGIVEGLRAWDQRSAKAGGPLTTGVTAILALIGLTFSIAFHAVVFLGALYRSP